MSTIEQAQRPAGFGSSIIYQSVVKQAVLLYLTSMCTSMCTSVYTSMRACISSLFAWSKQ